jgi:hypothetical protein
MAVYRTCTNCARAKSPCVRRDEISKAIKGASITSVKFLCADRIALFLPGQRVAVTWPVSLDGEAAVDESWGATVISENGSRFLIAVDDAESDNETPIGEFLRNERLFAKVSPSKLRALDEAPRAICGWCQRAPAPGEVCTNKVGWEPSTPPNCLAIKLAESTA